MSGQTVSEAAASRSSGAASAVRTRISTSTALQDHRRAPARRRLPRRPGGHRPDHQCGKLGHQAARLVGSFHRWTALTSAAVGGVAWAPVWLHPQEAGISISPIFFADLYWGSARFRASSQSKGAPGSFISLTAGRPRRSEAVFALYSIRHTHCCIRSGDREGEADYGPSR